MKYLVEVEVECDRHNCYSCEWKRDSSEMPGSDGKQKGWCRLFKTSLRADAEGVYLRCNACMDGRRVKES